MVGGVRVNKLEDLYVFVRFGLRFWSSAELVIEAHLDSSGLALFNRLEDLVAVLARAECELELWSTLFLTHNPEVLDLHLEAWGQRLVILAVLEVEAGAESSIEELEECLWFAKLVGLVVIHVAGGLHHLVVREGSRVRHVLQAVLAAVLCPSQDDNMFFTGLNSEVDVLAIN